MLDAFNEDPASRTSRAALPVLLNHACRTNNYELLARLLQYDVDDNRFDHIVKSPLYLAMEKSNESQSKAAPLR